MYVQLFFARMADSHLHAEVFKRATTFQSLHLNFYEGEESLIINSKKSINLIKSDFCIRGEKKSANIIYDSVKIMPA